MTGSDNDNGKDDDDDDDDVNSGNNSHYFGIITCVYRTQLLFVHYSNSEHEISLW